MVPYENPTLTSHYWLVVWNMNFMFPFSWKCHNPNWRTPLFFRGVGIPPTSIIWPLLNDVKLGLFNHQITIRHSNHHSITINKPTIQSPWNHHSITIFLWFSYGFPTIQSVEISNSSRSDPGLARISHLCVLVLGFWFSRTTEAGNEKQRGRFFETWENDDNVEY